MNAGNECSGRTKGFGRRHLWGRWEEGDYGRGRRWKCDCVACGTSKYKKNEPTGRESHGMIRLPKS